MGKIHDRFKAGNTKRVRSNLVIGQEQMQAHAQKLTNMFILYVSVSIFSIYQQRTSLDVPEYQTGAIAEAINGLHQPFVLQGSMQSAVVRSAMQMHIDAMFAKLASDLGITDPVVLDEINNEVQAMLKDSRDEVSRQSQEQLTA